MKSAWFAPLALLVSGCLFETQNEKTEPLGIHPDLSIGNQWMYRFSQYVETQDSVPGDTVRYFIHYGIEGDTLIAGVSYRILSEEDLAVFNTDYGLVKARSLYAVQADSFSLNVKLLRPGGGTTGRLPFKSAAPSSLDAAVFDTADFEDEFTVLKMPLSAGQGWVYRAEGQPYGHAAATKTFLGGEDILVAGSMVHALKFQVAVEGLAYVRTYEWYGNDIKLFSRSSSAANSFSKDSLRSEEEYLGKRYFSRADTQAVLDASNIRAKTK